MKTTQEINDNIIAQLESSLSTSIPLLNKSFLRVLSRVYSGVYVVLYKYGGFIALQQFVSTASFKDTDINGKTVNPLKEWGNLIGVGNPKTATAAELLIDVTVESQTGVLVAGSKLVGLKNGITYITTSEVSLNAATVQVNILAIDSVGVLGNLSPADIVSFVNPLANVAKDAVVVSQSITGAEAETEQQYRARVISRFKKRPRGGALSDYQYWGNSAEGILNVYPYTSDCPGQVDIYVESATETDGIPTTAQLQAVVDYVNADESGLATRRPANALVNAFSISRVQFDIIIKGLSVSNESAVQSELLVAIEEYYLSREPFISGLSVAPRTDRVTRSAVAGIVEDIVTARGGLFLNVIMSLTGDISNEIYTLNIGEKSKLVNLYYES